MVVLCIELLFREFIWQSLLRDEVFSVETFEAIELLSGNVESFIGFQQ